MNKDFSLKNLTPETTVSQITAADEHAAEMLASIGLDITHHKHDTLRSVCRQQQWSEVEVLQWIKKHRSSAEDVNMRNGGDINRNLFEWCKHLEKEYHVSNKKLLREIADDLLHDQQYHSNQFEWIVDMKRLFNQFEEKLRMHYWFKEKTFFPLVIRLHDRRNKKVLHGTVHKLERGLGIIGSDHAQLERLMDIIRKKSNDFVNPTNGYSTLHILFQKIKRLFENLRHHFWLEKNRFLPELRKQLKEIN